MLKLIPGYRENGRILLPCALPWFWWYGYTLVIRNYRYIPYVSSALMYWRHLNAKGWEGDREVGMGSNIGAHLRTLLWQCISSVNLKRGVLFQGISETTRKQLTVFLIFFCFLPNLRGLLSFPSQSLPLLSSVRRSSSSSLFQCIDRYLVTLALTVSQIGCHA